MQNHIQQNVMKKAIILSAALVTGLMLDTRAQTGGGPSSAEKRSVNGIVSEQGKSMSNKTSSVEGMQRKGSGKMSAGVTRNGNSNLSPTSPTNTQGSTSQGSASVPSTGGAKGARTVETKQKNSTSAAKSTKNGTATDGGLTSNGTPTYGAKVDTRSTSGSTGGSKRPTTTEAVRKEARTSDKNVSTGYPEPTGPGKPGTPSGRSTGGNSYPQNSKAGGTNTSGTGKGGSGTGNGGKQ